MLVDKDELERRLASPKNLVRFLDNSSRPSNHTSPPQFGKPHASATHTVGSGAPVIVKAVAGALALQTSVPEVSREFGIREGTVRAATHSRDPEVRERVDGARDRVRELALNKLMESLGLLSEEKIAKGSARDISVVAANMSKVVDRVTPKDVGTNVQLIVYAPQQRKESEFDVVEV